MLAKNRVSRNANIHAVTVTPRLSYRDYRLRIPGLGARCADTGATTASWCSANDAAVSHRVLRLLRLLAMFTDPYQFTQGGKPAGNFGSSSYRRP